MSTSTRRSRARRGDIYIAPGASKWPLAALVSLCCVSPAVGLAGCAGLVNSTPSNPNPQNGSVGVAVTPASASVQIGVTQQFAVTITGTSNSSVTWSATGGSISSAGLYKAGNSAGTFVVTATSMADSSKKAQATVKVTSTPPP